MTPAPRFPPHLGHGRSGRVITRWLSLVYGTAPRLSPEPKHNQATRMTSQRIAPVYGTAPRSLPHPKAAASMPRKVR